MYIYIHIYAFIYTYLGVLQLGAGTSIYRNLGDIPISVCPQYLSVVPLFRGKYLVSFDDHLTNIATVAVLEIHEKTKKSVIISQNVSTHDLYKVVTLDQGETCQFFSLCSA
jgi:hypothetical protein